MNIFEIFKKPKPEPVKFYTVTMTFKTANGGYIKATHSNVKEIILYKTCGATNSSVVHRLELLDGSIVIYVDEPNKTLVEFQKSAPNTATFE